jgi:transcriptional regulator with XRE-family HTH domain
MQNHIIMNDKAINLNTAGERLKYLRSLVRLDRKIISEKYNIPEITLRQWENGKISLTKKGVDRCVEAYLQEGLNVKSTWLQDGIGETPKLDYTLISFIENTSSHKTPMTPNIVDDYQYFSKTYKNCILFNIITEEMNPIYKPGDFVMGRISTNITDLNTKDCIVNLISGEIVFRRIFINELDQVNLSPINPFSQIEPIFNAQIKTIAPIIFHYIT